MPESDRFLQVALFNSYEERIVLAIDKADVYIVGYRTGDKACFFNDTNGTDTSSVFPGIERYQLPFNSSYSGMEEIAGSRKNISLRISELDSIKNLYKLDEASSLARCMLFTVQMVAEAIRYRYVEGLVVEHISETSQAYLPTATMITFEENWDELSTRIQESVGGAIYPPFVLSDAFSNQDVTITSITPTLGRNIAVVRYVCDSCTNIPEPAVHIIGRNGL